MLHPVRRHLQRVIRHIRGASAINKSFWQWRTSVLMWAHAQVMCNVTPPTYLGAPLRPEPSTTLLNPLLYKTMRVLKIHEN